MKDIKDSKYGKQQILVSGSNIKTINGTSLLGSGNLPVSAAPGGSDTQVQFNDNGILGGDSGLTYNKTTNILSGVSVDLSGHSALGDDASIDANAVLYIREDGTTYGINSVQSIQTQNKLWGSTLTSLAASPLTFQTNETSRMTIDQTTGNVNVLYNLDVDGNSAFGTASVSPNVLVSGIISSDNSTGGEGMGIGITHFLSNTILNPIALPFEIFKGYLYVGGLAEFTNTLTNGLFVTDNANPTTVSDIRGVQSTIGSTTGTITNAYGFRTTLNQSGGVIGGYYGVYIDRPTSVSIDTLYGLYITDQSGLGNFANDNIYSLGANSLNRFEGQIVMTHATGVAPFSVNSTTVNTNLNADLWDGYQFGDYLDQSVKTSATPSFLSLTLTEATGVAPLTIASTTVVNNLNSDLWDGYQFSDYLDQAVKIASTPTFAGLTADSDTLGLYLGADQDVLLYADSAGSFYFKPAADTDMAVKFFGTTNSGLFTWMEDEDRFDFADDICPSADNSEELGNGTNGWKTLYLSDANSINVATEGAIRYDADEKGLTAFLAGVKQNFESTLFTQTAVATVANTTSETALSSTGVGTLTLPANFFTAGKSVRVKANGYYSTTTVAPTLLLRVKFGSTIIHGTGAFTQVASQTNQYWEVESVITCYTTGVTGTVWAQGRKLKTAVGAGAPIESMRTTAAVTVNTTASQAINLTAIWGTADATNTISLTNLTVEILN